MNKCHRDQGSPSLHASRAQIFCSTTKKLKVVTH
jgi:hypothetical protein